jgi:hypothetical protein
MQVAFAVCPCLAATGSYNFGNWDREIDERMFQVLNRLREVVFKDGCGM